MSATALAGVLGVWIVVTLALGIALVHWAGNPFDGEPLWKVLALAPVWAPYGLVGLAIAGGVVETTEKWKTFHCPDCGEQFALLDKTVREEVGGS